MTETLSKKVCLLGEFAVGKTSLVRRFVYSLYDDRYLSTLGVKVSRKTVSLARADDVVELNMVLWDLAGTEEFGQVRNSYLRGAAGAILVCDLTRPETVSRLTAYVAALRALSPQAALVLAGNKRDLTEQVRVSQAEIEESGRALGAPCYLTSAKTGDGVEELFRHLGRLLVA